jgi:hypothetical protein
MRGAEVEQRNHGLDPVNHTARSFDLRGFGSPGGTLAKEDNPGFLDSLDEHTREKTLRGSVSRGRIG